MQGAHEKAAERAGPHFAAKCGGAEESPNRCKPQPPTAPRSYKGGSWESADGLNSDVNNAIMREGLLSSHSFACIEVDFTREEGKYSGASEEKLLPWTVVRKSQGARALFAPWGELTGKDFLHMIHRDNIDTLLSLDLRQQSKVDASRLGLLLACSISSAIGSFRQIPR